MSPSVVHWRRSPDSRVPVHERRGPAVDTCPSASGRSISRGWVQGGRCLGRAAASPLPAPRAQGVVTDTLIVVGSPGEVMITSEAVRPSEPVALSERMPPSPLAKSARCTSPKAAIWAW